MKLINYIGLILCLIMGNFSTINAQSNLLNPVKKEEVQIFIIAAPKGDSIKLRWAPATREAWLLGNELGYNLIRFTISRDGELLNSKERNQSRKVIAQDLNHLNQEEWFTLLEKEEDDYLLLGAGTLFDEQFTIENTAKSILEVDKIEEDESRKKQRFTFALFAADQSFPTAEAMGLGFVDKAVNKNEGYMYQVVYGNKLDKNKYEVTIGEVTVPINEIQTLPSPVALAGNFSDHKVTLEWDNEAVKSYYTTYFLERSEDGENFVQRNETPIAFIDNTGKQKFVYYADTLEENHKNYIYRVRGKTPFGEFGAYSDTIQGQGFPGPIPAIPTIFDVVEFPEKNITLRWEFDETYNDAIEGFQLYRAPTSSGPFLPILDTPISPTERTFVDTLPLGIAYYFISALDTNGYKLSSFPVLAQLVDLDPPAPPINIEGKLDPETGEVTLKWSPNTEDDLAGYRVFFANNPNDHFAQITSQVLRDTTHNYTVTMNTTTEEVYFKVIATDFRENFSPYSEICVVRRPDMHPPTPPLIRKVNALENRIVLTYATSSSKDVILHKIERKTIGMMNWETLNKDSLQEIAIREFSDFSAEFEKVYEYRITAIDDAELVTSSKSIRSKLIDKGVRDSVANFTVLLLEEEEGAKHTIKWEYPEKWEIDEFVLYRGVNEDKVRTYKRLKPEEVFQQLVNVDNKTFSFEPTNVKKGTTYFYQLIAILKGGNTSPLTKMVSISTKN